jgi:glycosyltransferase involved in cell wall biosynthesis
VENFSLVVPYFNNERCINNVFATIGSQSVKPNQIVLVDDFSQIPAIEVISQTLMDQLKSLHGVDVIVCRNDSNLGLAATYNRAVSLCDCEAVVIMHPDIVLPSQNELAKLLEPLSDPSVVIVGHQSVAVDICYWEELHLAEKLFVAAAESKRAKGFNGQFDAFRRCVFEQVGGFNSNKFRTAGEDGDFCDRVMKLGGYALSSAVAQHHHDFRGHLGLRGSLKKSVQYGNAQSQQAFKGNMLISAHREILLVLALVSIFIGASIFIAMCFLILVVVLRLPLLVYRRDREKISLLICVGIETLRYFAHVSGFLLGLRYRKQTV